MITIRFYRHRAVIIHICYQRGPSETVSWFQKCAERPSNNLLRGTNLYYSLNVGQFRTIRSLSVNRVNFELLVFLLFFFVQRLGTVLENSITVYHVL